MSFSRFLAFSRELQQPIRNSISDHTEMEDSGMDVRGPCLAERVSGLERGPKTSTIL